MFSKKFISFTVISGVLASSLSQLGFAENGSVENEAVVGKNENNDLETASNSEDLSLKNEPEEKELVSKSEDNDDNSSEDVDDLKNEENDEDSDNSDDDDSDSSGDSSLYQWWKEALGNKFEAAKPYFKKAQETLKTYLKEYGDFLGKVANHEAFLPTATAFTTAAGTYKLFEKLNNINKTNENLTGVQEPEHPQEVVTPSPQQDHNVEEENKKIDDENNKNSGIEHTSGDFEVKAAKEEGNERHYAFLATMTFIILFFGGISWYLLKKSAVKKRNKGFLKLTNELEKYAKISRDYTATAQGNIMDGDLVKFAASKDSPSYKYLKKCGYIKGDKKGVWVAFFPCFSVDLKNFEDVSSPKVHILLTNMFIDDEEVKSNENLSLKRDKDGFQVNLRGVDLTFNLKDEVDYNALTFLMNQTIKTIRNSEKKNKSQEIGHILCNILMSNEVFNKGKVGDMYGKLRERKANGVLWDEEELYKFLKNLILESKDTINIDAIEKGGDLILTDSNTDKNNFEKNKINSDEILKKRNEIKMERSNNIKKILKFLGVDTKKYEGGTLDENNLFDILREEFLKKSNDAIQVNLKVNVKDSELSQKEKSNEEILIQEEKNEEN